MAFFVNLTDIHDITRTTPLWRSYATIAKAKKAAMGFVNRDANICRISINWTSIEGPDFIAFRRMKDEHGNWMPWEKTSIVP